MEIKVSDIVIFENSEYLVLDVININSNTYLYLINNDPFDNDMALVKTKKVNDLIEFDSIKDNEEFNTVLSKLVIDYKDELLAFANNE